MTARVTARVTERVSARVTVGVVERVTRVIVPLPNLAFGGMCLGTIGPRTDHTQAHSGLGRIVPVYYFTSWGRSTIIWECKKGLGQKSVQADRAWLDDIVQVIDDLDHIFF